MITGKQAVREGLGFERQRVWEGGDVPLAQGESMLSCVFRRWCLPPRAVCVYVCECVCVLSGSLGVWNPFS